MANENEDLIQGKHGLWVTRKERDEQLLHDGLAAGLWPPLSDLSKPALLAREKNAMEEVKAVRDAIKAEEKREARVSGVKEAKAKKEKDPRIERLCLKCNSETPKTGGGTPGPQNDPAWTRFDPSPSGDFSHTERWRDMTGDWWFCSFGCAREWMNSNLIRVPEAKMVSCTLCKGSGKTLKNMKEVSYCDRKMINQAIKHDHESSASEASQTSPLDPPEIEGT